MSKNTNINNRRILIAIYCASIGISSIYRLADYIVSKYISIVVALFWVLVGLCHYYVNRNNYTLPFKKNIRWIFKGYFIPSVLIYLWTIFLMMIGKVSWTYLTSNSTVFLYTLTAITAILLFKDKAFKYTAFGVIGAYFFTIFVALLIKGPAIFPSAFMESYFNIFGMYGISVNYFENHDTVLSIGYVLVYALYTNDKLTKRKFLMICCAVFVMLIGLKRIAVLAVFIAYLFYLIIKRMPEKRKYRCCLLCGMAMIVVFYFFNWILMSGDSLWGVIESLGINTRGRFYYWTALAAKGEFSPFFLGIGRNVSYKLFSGELSYMRVGGAHSDILKMYVENGFIVFGYWLYHYLISLTKQYKNRFSINAAVVYFGISIYLFVMYLTDNVEIYFVSILFSILIPVCYALKEEKLSIGSLNK